MSYLSIVLCCTYVRAPELWALSEAMISSTDRSDRGRGFPSVSSSSLLFIFSVQTEIILLIDTYFHYEISMNILYFHCTLCLLVFTAALFPFLFPWRFLALNLPHGLCPWLGYLFSLFQQIFCGLTLSKYKIMLIFPFALKIILQCGGADTS